MDEDSDVLGDNYYDQVQFPKLNNLNQQRYKESRQVNMNEYSRPEEGN